MARLSPPWLPTITRNGGRSPCRGSGRERGWVAFGWATFCSDGPNLPERSLVAVTDKSVTSGCGNDPTATHFFRQRFRRRRSPFMKRNAVAWTALVVSAAALFSSHGL